MLQGIRCAQSKMYHAIRYAQYVYRFINLKINVMKYITTGRTDSDADFNIVTVKSFINKVL